MSSQFEEDLKAAKAAISSVFDDNLEMKFNQIIIDGEYDSFTILEDIENAIDGDSNIISDMTLRDNTKIGLFCHLLQQVFKNHIHDIDQINISYQHLNIKMLMESTPITTIDLSIFLDDIQSIYDCKTYKQCKGVNRLLTSLKYYTKLQPRSTETSPDNKSIFDQFIMETYKYHIFDDFNHMTHKHGQEIHNVMNYAFEHFKFSPCQLDQCQYSSRHYEVDENNHVYSAEIDPHPLIYYDTFDSIHYYIFHLFQSGFRHSHEDITDMDDFKDDNDNMRDKYYYNHLTQYVKEYPITIEIFGFMVTKRASITFVIAFAVSQYAAWLISEITGEN